ncbi:lipopolysaccharide biosynthesis protein [Schlegelella sp. S2-27]|uniref:Lipopolysaccharide biosynthesis protein n=1 Tax=Caldimonas mangrovi TaxID=2944811 RepID=A0ABT0YRG7_9BURK|nr:lipopolysaccharide biosynthesis protein [Caldimonas mangrovi]MCM5681335.1 lipopolysaccharide biosynthesis protein [Caldimonas mangrovi]
MSALSNARWLGVAQAARVALQTGGVLVMSRLLSPRDYGLVAMALVVTNFAVIIRDLGTAQAVIQKKELDEETTQTAFWFSCAMGLAVGLAVVLIAPLLAAGYRTPEVAGILMLLALPFPIGASSAVHQALLERQHRFATIARIEVTSQAFGLLAGIVAALNGLGPYSLVVQTLVAPILGALQLWHASPWRPRLRFSRPALRGLWGFSGYLVSFQLVNYFSRNTDSFIIGRFLGPASLGPYTLAYRLMLFPILNLTLVASRALFPVMSRQQDTQEAMGRLYLRALFVIACVTGPLMAGLFVLRDEFVDTVLGSKWHEVADIVAWLAPVGFIQSLVSTTGTVFMATGRTRLLFFLGIYSAVLTVSAFVIGVQWGVLGVAQAYFVANVLNALPCLHIALRQVGRGLPDLARELARPLGVTALMAVAVVLAGEPLSFAVHSVLLRLVAGVAIGVAVYAALTFVLNRTAIQEFRRFVTR